MRFPQPPAPIASIPEVAVAAAPVAAVVAPVAPVADPVVVAPVVVAPVAPVVAAAVVAPVVAPAAAVVVEPVVVPGKAPDKYDLVAPEGGLVDAPDLEMFAVLAKARGWTNDEAQLAVTEHAAALAAQSARFRAELDAHTEIGGDKLASAQARGTAVLDRFLPATSPEGAALRLGLHKSGYANFAPLALLLARIGTAMGEDHAIAATVGAGKRSHAEVLFGDAKP